MNTTINYIAVDDNLIDAMVLREYAKPFGFLNEIGIYATPSEAITAIIATKPQLVFLDIDMPEMNGISLLKKIKDIVPVSVFVTSHDEYAIDGFNLAALDYVLKPLEKNRFEQTVNRIADYFKLKEKASQYDVSVQQQNITIKEGHTKVQLPVQDIIYLEAMQDYTKIVTEKKSYLTLMTLTGFMETLSSNQFLRVHRSYAVALKKVSRISGANIECGNFSVQIGKTYRNEIARLKL